MSSQAPDKPPSEEGLRKGGHTRSGPSAFGVVANKPANHKGDPGWTPAGRDAPEAKAELARREAAKLKSSTPKSAGGTGVLNPASKRTGQAASNAVGKGRGR